MTTTHTSAEIVERDGVLVGPLREPRNLAANVAGSIHDDSQAQKLGFRGGTVAGSIHMEQFPPLLLRAFGERWFETGSALLLLPQRHDGPRARAGLRAAARQPGAARCAGQRLDGPRGRHAGAGRHRLRRHTRRAIDAAAQARRAARARRAAHPRRTSRSATLGAPVTVRLADEREAQAAARRRSPSRSTGTPAHRRGAGRSSTPACSCT